jgi:hypothetical protein
MSAGIKKLEDYIIKTDVNNDELWDIYWEIRNHLSTIAQQRLSGSPEGSPKCPKCGTDNTIILHECMVCDYSETVSD